MSYSELLRDPRWQRKRLEVLEREEWACEECGDKTTTLHVHHTYYAKGKKPWEYPTESLRCLCAPCHLCVTEATQELQRLIGGSYRAVVDMLVGYARVIAGDGISPIRVESAEVAIGVAHAFRVSEERVIDMAIASVDKELTVEALHGAHKDERSRAVEGISNG